MWLGRTTERNKLSDEFDAVRYPPMPIDAHWCRAVFIKHSHNDLQSFLLSVTRAKVVSHMDFHTNSLADVRTVGLLTDAHLDAHNKRMDINIGITMSIQFDVQMDGIIGIHVQVYTDNNANSMRAWILLSFQILHVSPAGSPRNGALHNTNYRSPKAGPNRLSVRTIIPVDDETRLEWFQAAHWITGGSCEGRSMSGGSQRDPFQCTLMQFATGTYSCLGGWTDNQTPHGK